MRLSNADKQKRYRAKKSNARRYPCIIDYITTREQGDYVWRKDSSKLNWGVWMNSSELEHAGLRANRVPIPGDWDYKGVA